MCDKYILNGKESVHPTGVMSGRKEPASVTDSLKLEGVLQYDPFPLPRQLHLCFPPVPALPCPGVDVAAPAMGFLTESGTRSSLLLAEGPHQTCSQYLVFAVEMHVPLASVTCCGPLGSHFFLAWLHLVREGVHEQHSGWVVEHPYSIQSGHRCHIGTGPGSQRTAHLTVSPWQGQS